MLVLIENEPRDYVWGSRSALAELLGRAASGNPEAELWMGVHPQSPSRVAKATPTDRTLIDLIEADPERYGVGSIGLPFLLKLLAIDAPLSLQVHPTVEQAELGFDAEEARSVPVDAPHRNYRDRNHKPELLVALSPVRALSGFRSLAETRADIAALAEVLPVGAPHAALQHALSLCTGDATKARESLLSWALSSNSQGGLAAEAIALALSLEGSKLSTVRLESLQRLCAEYPGDPGVLVSLLLHVVELEPGQAIYLPAGQLHAYLSGLAVEIMATSDNVLRGGLTVKHIDCDELLRITSFEQLSEPRFEHREIEPGLLVWQPPVPDFQLLRATVSTEPIGSNDELERAASQLGVPTPYPMTLVVTQGKVQIERVDDGVSEIARLKRGQALYVSTGGALTLSGDGQVYPATVGADWGTAQ